jgi:ketosteroid isomerase-like protein
MGAFMIFRILPGLALLAATALAHADSAADNAAAEKAIRSSLQAWVESANRQDWKAALQVWAPDLIGWAPAGSDDTYPREAEFAAHPQPPSHTTFALTINEVIIDGSLAVVRDTWTETTKPDSGPATADTFRSFEIWRRQPDKSWKISRWIDGPVVPQPTLQNK